MALKTFKFGIGEGYQEISLPEEHILQVIEGNEVLNWMMFRQQLLKHCVIRSTASLCRRLSAKAKSRCRQ
ncbi:MAG: hypothetical protein ACLRXQ_10080 [Phascolarctobacterium faecium]